MTDHKTHIAMKKRIFFFLMAVCAGIAQATAQKGFAVNELFDGSYRGNKNATETLLKDSRLDDLKLDVYHSLVVTGSQSDALRIERLVTKDGARASNKEQTFRNGHLYYGFYVFNKAGWYSYIFYLNKHLSGGDSATIIYMEGEATPIDVQRMLK